MYKIKLKDLPVFNSSREEIYVLCTIEEIRILDSEDNTVLEKDYKGNKVEALDDIIEFMEDKEVILEDSDTSKLLYLINISDIEEKVRFFTMIDMLKNSDSVYIKLYKIGFLSYGNSSIIEYLFNPTKENLIVTSINDYVENELKPIAGELSRESINNLKFIIAHYHLTMYNFALNGIVAVKERC